MTVILETKNLEKTFGAVTAAADINVSVSVGEIVGVIGSNGAGKTTFINMVTGYLRPSGGEIRVAGRNVAGMKPRDVSRAGVGRTFQVAQLFPELTVVENMLIALGMSRGRALSFWKPMDNPEDRARVLATLEDYQIAEHAESTVATLPQGVRKLLDIAMATVREPRLLLLDEPTSGVATEDKFQMMETVMASLDTANSATLFVEHDMEVVLRYAHRVLAFYDGRILADGPTAEVLANPKVKELVVGNAVTPRKEEAEVRNAQA
jgi:branched-chain amino acid transport system ATP-binding protein